MDTNVQVSNSAQIAQNQLLADVKIEIYIGFWHDFQIFENGIMKFSSKYLGYQSFWDAPNWEEWQVSHPLAKEAIRYSKHLMKQVGAKDFKEWFDKISFYKINEYPFRFDRYACLYIS